MAGWQDAPIVSAAPAWQGAPIVDGPAAQSGYGAYQEQQDPLDLPGVSPDRKAPPQPQGADWPSVVLQGANNGIADFLGAPGDLSNLAVNAGALAVNSAGHLAGRESDIFPYLPPSPIGSKAISDKAGALYQAVTGHPVLTEEQMSPQQRAVYAGTRMGVQSAATESLGPLVTSLFRSASPVIAETRMPIPAAAEQTAPAAKTLRSAAAAGFGGGVGQYAYDEAVPDQYKEKLGPVGSLIAGLAGGVGGATANDILEFGARQAARPAAAVKSVVFGDSQPGFALADGTRVSPRDMAVAAQIAQDSAIDPAAAAERVTQGANEFRANGTTMPTSGAMSADPGLVGLEAAARLDPKLRAQFIANDRAVQQSAVDAAGTIAPPAASGRQFTDFANAQQAGKVADAQGKVTATQAQVDQLQNELRAQAAPVRTAVGTDAKAAASQQLDNVIVDQTLRPMQEENSRLFGQVDPTHTAVINANPLVEAAATVESSLGDLNSPDKVIPRGLLHRIGDTVPKDKKGNAAGPAQTSIGDIVDVYPELTTTEDRARKAGNYQLADNIRVLRSAMDDLLNQEAAAGNPAAQRALLARANYQQTIGATFGGGPKDPARVFRQDFNQDRLNRTTTPPSQTAPRFLQPGQPEKTAALERVISASEDQDGARQAVGQYLMSDMAHSVLNPDGTVDPAALDAWKAKWGSAVDLAPGFRQQLDALSSGAQDGAARASQLKAQLQAEKAAYDATVANDTAFKNVVGASPANAVAAVFASRDPEATMKDIVAGLGDNQQAKDGLKAALREYLTEKATTSALQKTTTGDNPLSFAKLDTLFKQNEAALAAVLSPEEMHSLQVAHKFLGSLKNLEQQSLAGSATAERGMLSSEQLWKYLEVGLKLRYGGLKGGNLLRTARIYASMIGSDRDNVRRLLAEMQFNPELAAHLLTKDVAAVGAPTYNRKLFRLIVAPSAAQRNSDEGNSPVPTITIPGPEYAGHAVEK